jgi:hypothetical protein
MNEAIARMLARYEARRLEDYVRALREILQEIALLGLWRSKFFEHAAFYGGTALRILYGIDRFSDDLDFSLIRPSSRFDLSRYSTALQTEIQSFGFEVRVVQKEKEVRSAIQSAFLKADTLKQLVVIEAGREVIRELPRGQVLKIKIEVDADPPPGFETETRFLLHPIPFGQNLCAARPFCRKDACFTMPEMEEPGEGPGLVRPGMVYRQSSAASSLASGAENAPERGSGEG